MGQLSAQLRVYVVGVALAGGLFLAAATWLSPPDARQLAVIAFFVVLGVVADANPVRLPRGAAVSAAFAVQFACVITEGTMVAVWMGWLSAVILLWGKPWYKIAFNAGESALTCGLSALAFQAAGGDFLARSLQPQPIFHYWPALAAAGACYITVNNLAVHTALALEKKTPLLGTWLANFRKLILQFCALAPFGVLIAMVYQVPDVGPTGVALFLMPLFWARYAFKGYMEMRDVHDKTVDALTIALERYDPYTEDHSSRVRAMALALAKTLGYPNHKMEALLLAALLHDIGKFAMEPVLHKKEKLTEADWNLIKQHPEKGHDIVAEIEVEKNAAQIVLATHERPDGTGYPQRLADREISLAAKIIAVVDAFDAMISKRPYRDPLPLEVALEELVKGSGTQFDPKVVEVAIHELPRVLSELKELEPARAGVP
jgi:putative nucleotidyltransferase with HDIG domain